MFGVDPDAARSAKNGALSILNLVIPRVGGAWEYANYHCGTASNFYSLVRFVPRGGREPLEHADCRMTPGALVTGQVPTTYRLSEVDQIVVRNDGDGCQMEVSRGDRTLYVQLLDISHCSVAVSLWSPFLGGALRRNIFGPYEGGYLIDDSGQINDRSVAVIADLANDLAVGSARLIERREDIERTATIVRERMEALEESDSHEDRVEQIWDSLPRPPSDVDAIVFRSIISDWLRLGCYLFLKGWDKAEGREDTRILKSETYTETEFVRKQLGRTEQVAPSGKLTFYEAYESVAFRLERESGKIYGYLMQLTHDSVAMELSVPTRTGCMIRSIFSTWLHVYGHLIDAEGRLNDFGIQKLIELIDDMQTAVLAMEERIGDIQVAAHAVLERSKATDEPHDDDEYVMQIWEALPGPPIDVDVTSFRCIVERWIWRSVHGLIAPEGWGQTP
jgi:hypothetical protein